MRDIWQIWRDLLYYVDNHSIQCVYFKRKGNYDMEEVRCYL